MKQLKKTILTLVALLAVTTGAWADELYLVVNGTSATVMYGDKGSNPYYGPRPNDPSTYGWWVPGDSYSGKSSLTTVTIDASCQNYTGTTLEKFFSGWYALTTINNLENLNTSEVTSMKQMFSSSSSLTSFDPSSWNTAKVTNMQQMFNNLPVETLDLSGWNTSSVTSMKQMFSNCTKLSTIYVGDGWSTASVTDGSYMFYNCTSLPGYDAYKVDATNAHTGDGGYLTYKAPAAAGPEVTWTAASKTGTFDMPGGNVELEPEYYPQATAEGAVTAATGVAATTDAPLVTVDETKLTGVAKMMYYVSTSTTAPAYDAEGWTDVLPTAANYTEAGNLNVWYYPVGTDEGVGGAAATYSDGDICATALTVTLAPAPTYAVTLKEGTDDATSWKGKAGSGDYQELPLESVAAGTAVTVKYNGTLKVKSVKAKKKAAAAAGPTLDIATVTTDITIEDGYTLTGTFAEGVNVKVSIAEGATVTLDGVTINGVNDASYPWAGINCLGDATIILSGTNTVKGFHQNYPGIHVPVDKTLTIQGSGSLTASSNGPGCGIGGGNGIACGNIVIAGGTINATGGESAAGIGGGYGSCGTISITGGTITANGGSWAAGIGSGIMGSCGNISITGGTVNATGGEYAAGIGSGSYGSCGDITITNGVTSVTATKGNDAPYSIGAGNSGSCGTVTIGGTVYWQNNAAVGDGATYLATSPLEYQPSN